MRASTDRLLSERKGFELKWRSCFCLCGQKLLIPMARGVLARSRAGTWQPLSSICAPYLYTGNRSLQTCSAESKIRFLPDDGTCSTCGRLTKLPWPIQDGKVNRQGA
jgi:hypothetical protein